MIGTQAPEAGTGQVAADGTVGIVGLGYVGLTLAVVMAEEGFEVHGIETSERVVDTLRSGVPHFHEDGLESALREQVGKRLCVSTGYPRKPLAAYVITVGTPLAKPDRTPRMDYVIRAVEAVRDHIIPGALVVLRSTVPVGTTRDVVYPLLRERCADVLVAFCPERTVEGRALREIRELPQIIGGIDERSAEAAMRLFRRLTPNVLRVSSPEVAEMIKLVDNSWRDLIFGYANDIAMICERVGVDGAEVIRSANIGYARNNVPRAGYVGGACLSKDPHILLDLSRRHGYDPLTVFGAREVNESLPRWSASRLHGLYERAGRTLRGSKLVLSGLAFKGVPATGDLRDSPSLDLLAELRDAGADLYGHDFVVGEAEIAALGLTPAGIDEAFAGADCVIVANNHPGYERLDILALARTMRAPGIIYDAWRLFDRRILEREGIIYGGLGCG